MKPWTWVLLDECQTSKLKALEIPIPNPHTSHPLCMISETNFIFEAGNRYFSHFSYEMRIWQRRVNWTLIYFILLLHSTVTWIYSLWNSKDDNYILNHKCDVWYGIHNTYIYLLAYVAFPNKRKWFTKVKNPLNQLWGNIYISKV